MNRGMFGFPQGRQLVGSPLRSVVIHDEHIHGVKNGLYPNYQIPVPPPFQGCLSLDFSVDLINNNSAAAFSMRLSTVGGAGLLNLQSGNATAIDTHWTAFGRIIYPQCTVSQANEMVYNGWITNLNQEQTTIFGAGSSGGPAKCLTAECSAGQWIKGRITIIGNFI